MKVWLHIEHKSWPSVLPLRQALNDLRALQVPLFELLLVFIGSKAHHDLFCSPSAREVLSECPALDTSYVRGTF